MKNFILSSLSAGNLDRLHAYLDATELSPGERVQSRDKPMAGIYFPEEGLVSLLAGPGEQRVEAALVGREGIVGTAAILGRVRAAHDALVQTPGRGWMLPNAALADAFESVPNLRELLFGYLDVCLTEAMHVIFAASKCTVEQRLASWLMMAHDRLGQDDLHLTHECLANTLGVRRPGITVALHVLEGEHAIRSRRGRITVRDRNELRRMAGAAYFDPRFDRPVVEAPLAQSRVNGSVGVNGMAAA